MYTSVNFTFILIFLFYYLFIYEILNLSCLKRFTNLLQISCKWRWFLWSSSHQVSNKIWFISTHFLTLNTLFTPLRYITKCEQNVFRKHMTELWYIICKFPAIILISCISILKNKIRKTITSVTTLCFEILACFFSRVYFASYKIKFAGLQIKKWNLQ